MRNPFGTLEKDAEEVWSHGLFSHPSSAIGFGWCGTSVSKISLGGKLTCNYI
jgi:hypothetical protein